MHINIGTVEFVSHESGYYYLDMKDHEDVAIALVTIIRENFEGYIKILATGAIK